MALFNRKKKPTAPKKQQKQPEVLWSRSYPQSGSFRGYRRIRLSRYFHEKIDKSIAYFEKSDYSMKGRTIQLTCLQFDKHRPDGHCIDIFADGLLLGTVWQSDEEQWSMLTEYEYDKVYLKIGDTWPGCTDPSIVHTSVHLFVHYPADAPIKVDVK